MQRTFTAEMGETFSEFISSIAFPCVYCFPSECVIRECPEYYAKMREVWQDIMQENDILRIRLVFYDQLPYVSLAKKQLGQLELDDMDEQLLFLTKTIIGLEYMPLNSFIDLPISVLAIIRDNEEPKISTKLIPKWAIPYFSSSMKSNILRFPCESDEQLKEKLKNWFLKILIRRFNALVRKAGSEYENYCKGWQQDFKMFFVNYDDLNNYMITLKYYADLNLIQRKYNIAKNCYEKLLSNIPSQNNLFLSQVYYLLAINDIINNKITKKTSKYLELSSDSSSFYYHKIKCNLVDFWVRKSNSLLLKLPLNNITQIQDNSKIFNLVKPFVYEYLGKLSFGKTKALYLSLAGYYFEKLDFFKRSVKCYWESYLMVKTTNCDFIVNSLLLKIINISKETDFKINYSQELERVLLSRTLFNDGDILKFFHMKDNVLLCRFVNSRIFYFESKGFTCCPPPNLKFDKWFMISEKLFGALSNNKFYSMKNSNDYKGSVNLPITFKIRLAYNFPKKQLSNFKLLSNGITDISTSEVTNTESNLIDLSITPKKPGKLTIYGISFNLNNTLNLKSLFMDNSLKFVIYERVPNISIYIDDFSKHLFIGESILIKIKIKNDGLDDLDHLGLLICSEIKTILYKPKIEEICNQYFLKNLKKDEEIDLKIAVHADKAGKFNLLLLFPYWSINSPPRYEYLSYDFNVKDFKMENPVINLNSYELTCPDCEPYGIYSPYFNASIFVQASFQNKLYIDFITKYQDKEELKFPGYVQLFRSNSSLSYWYKTKNGYVEYPLDYLDIKISAVLMNIKDNKYELKIKNISKNTFTDIKISIVSPVEDLCFILNGVKLRTVDRLIPLEEITLKFSYISFVKSIRPRLLFLCEQFALSETIQF